MWLFTRHGFYSITRSTISPKKLQIRARSRTDLENLQTLTRNRARILETTDSDYRWRILVSPAEGRRIVGRLASDIVYSNFKHSIASRPDQRHRHADHHRIWTIHRGWQTDRR